MGKLAFSIIPSQTTDAEFRAWVSACISAMTSVGLVQTADTGQINTATVATTTAAGQVQGYVIFRFNDTLQSAAPIYFKVEFGSSGASVKPTLWLTVGKGSNGAGTISGVLFARALLTNSSASNSTATTAQDSYAVAGEGYGGLFPAAGWTGMTGGGTIPGWFLIERSCDAVGNPTADGITVTTIANGGSGGTLASATLTGSLPMFHAINYATAATNQGIVPVVVPNKIQGVTLAGTQALAAGGIGPVFPWVAIAPTLAPWQCVNAVSYPGGDNPGGTFQVTLGGVTRTYMAVPLSDNMHGFGASLAGTGAAISRYVGLGLRWE